MSDAPDISPEDVIYIGKGLTSKRAVVCNIYEGEGRVEVVYLDDRDRAINEKVRWAGDHWEFVRKGPGGGYADHYGRLARYVAILRAGRSG